MQNQLLTQNLFNMKTQNPKFIILIICFLAFSFNAVAQEIIQFTTTFTWATYGEFTITATSGKQFTVDWGDDSDIETITGTDYYQEIKHYYTTPGDYTVIITGTTIDCLFTTFSVSGGYGRWLTHLEVSKSPSLQYLSCSNGKLNTLDLSNNIALRTLYCNKSDLYTLILNSYVTLNSFRCYGNQLNSLSLKNSTTLKILNCSDNQLNNLYVSSNNELENFYCQNNKLPLSNLYEISKTLKPNSESEIVLGEQRLTSRTIEVGEQVDFSAEKEFGGFATVFTIEKDNLPAQESDYTITGGIITFFTEGKYRVRMCNSGFFEGWPILISPANVFVEINVGNVGIETITKDELRITVYPNPTMGELRITNYELRIDNIEIFDVYGRKVGAKFPSNVLEGWQPQAAGVVLNISHLSTGIYFIKITTKQGVITKKVIKN